MFKFAFLASNHESIVNLKVCSAIVSGFLTFIKTQPVRGVSFNLETAIRKLITSFILLEILCFLVFILFFNPIKFSLKFLTGFIKKYTQLIGLVEYNKVKYF